MVIAPTVAVALLPAIISIPIAPSCHARHRVTYATKHSLISPSLTGISGGMPRPMTNAERQRRYIARLKKAAVSNGGDAGLAKELAQAKAKIAELEDELARTKFRLKLAKAGLK